MGWGGWGGVGWGGYDQLCCPASPKLLLGLDLGLGCVNCCPATSKLLLGLDLRLGCDNLNFQPFFQRKDNEHKFLRPKTITTS